ncbi:hypothetical protein ES705_32191 [subsurface metagenome]
MRSQRFIFTLLLSIAYISGFAQNKPNIIFILTDDQRWDALGYSGNRIMNEAIDTPSKQVLFAVNIWRNRIQSF